MEGSPGAADLRRESKMPNPTAQELRAQAKGEGWSEDFERFSDPQLDAWLNSGLYDPSTGKFRSENDPSGPATYDKPAECPPGTTFHGSKCIPYDQLPSWATGSYGYGDTGARQGGGGGGGGGGGYGGGSQWDNPIYQYLKTTGLNAASSPEAALKAYMGYGGASDFQAQMDAARKHAESLPPGPTKDAAMASLERMRADSMRQMRQSAAGAARGELSSLMPQEYQYQGLGENARQANMQNALGWGGLGVQERLGWGNIGLGQQSQDLANKSFGWESGQKWQDTLGQNALDRQLQTDLMNKQIKANQPSTWQKILGGIGGLAGAAGSFMTGAGAMKFSDIRLKENITPSSKGLSELRKLPIYDYNYKWDSQPTSGVMAQDLEKVAPDLVHETPGGAKMVDLYGLLALTMSSIKELDKKVSARKGGK